MRRLLGVVLILVFWLGPLVALLPAGDESRLPACCRRHGAHHCAMASVGYAPASGATPVFGAPSQCPSYPATLVASVSPLDALAVSSSRTAAQLVTTYSPSAIHPALLPAALYTRLNRGPPAGKRT